MKATIDRFEDMHAVLVLDDGVEIAWPKDRLPAGAREGNVLSVTLELDPAGEKALRGSISELQNKLKRKGL